jgi:hypothetical protein
VGDWLRLRQVHAVRLIWWIKALITSQVDHQRCRLLSEVATPPPHASTVRRAGRPRLGAANLFGCCHRRLRALSLAPDRYGQFDDPPKQIRSAGMLQARPGTPAGGPQHQVLQPSCYRSRGPIDHCIPSAKRETIDVRPMNFVSFKCGVFYGIARPIRSAPALIPTLVFMYQPVLFGHISSIRGTS